MSSALKWKEIEIRDWPLWKKPFLFDYDHKIHPGTILYGVNGVLMSTLGFFQTRILQSSEGGKWSSSVLRMMVTNEHTSSQLNEQALNQLIPNSILRSAPIIGINNHHG